VQSKVLGEFSRYSWLYMKSVSVTIRLLEAIRIVAPHADGEMRRALHAQASMIHRQSDAMAIDARDRDDINARYSAAMAVLAPSIPRSVRTA
jgi:uncharacterized membrane protein